MTDFRLVIGTKAFEHWTSIEIVQSIDAFSQVSLTAPFEPESKAFREMFRPLSFTPIEVTRGNEPEFMGTLVCVDPHVTPTERSVSVEAYSRAGVLCDCCAPVEMRGGLAFNKLWLSAIAARLCEPFRVKVHVMSDVQAAASTPFRCVRIDQTQKVHDFLVGLAKQRGILLTDDEFGDLVMRRAVPASGATAEVHADLREGAPPLLSVKPTFNPQDYYSEITCVGSRNRGGGGGIFVQHNPFLPADLTRTATIQVEDIENGDVPRASRAQLARMIGHCASWEVELPGHLTEFGEQWRPNTIVSLLAPSAMIYAPTRLLVRRVTRRQTADTESTTLGLCLPGALSDGELPDRLPWDEADEERLSAGITNSLRRGL